MDPIANLTEQRKLAAHILTDERHDPSDPADDAANLSELVLALDEWQTNGGFSPYTPHSTPQDRALARLMRDRPEQGVTISRKPFDLPDGYWYVVFQPSGFTCGIAPDGAVSS